MEALDGQRSDSSSLRHRLCFASLIGSLEKLLTPIQFSLVLSAVSIGGQSDPVIGGLKMRCRLQKLLIAVVTVGGFALTSQPGLSQQWRPIRGGLLFGISGICLSDKQENFLSFLVVHDSKQVGQARLATVTLTAKEQPQYSSLAWPTSTALPTDLEAITAVPSETVPSYMVSTSSGKIYHLKLAASGKEVSILKVFDFPNVPKGSNFEGFALQEINGTLLAVWAHRGADEEAAVIYWGKLNLTTYQISQIGSASFKVPWPRANVRHISDLKVDPSGVLFIASATDSGNDGPFDSAIYATGTFNIAGNRVTFRQNPQLVPLYRLPYHKVEGIELVPGQAGGVVFGTDDENMGPSLYTGW